VPPLSTHLKTATLADELGSNAGEDAVVSLSNEFQVCERDDYTMEMNLPRVVQARKHWRTFCPGGNE